MCSSFTRAVPIICSLLVMSAVGNLLTMYADREVALVNSTLMLNCSLKTGNHSYTGGSLTWSHNETSLIGLGTQTDATSTVLLLQDVQIEDSGVYSCSLMEITASAYIRVGLLPQPATLLKCSCNDFRNVKCTWTRGVLDTNLPTTDEILEIENYEWTSCSTVYNKQVPTCTQTMCYMCCGVKLTVAKYRVRSHNLLGSVYTVGLALNTDDTIPNPPYNVKVSNLSLSSLNVTWQPPSELSLGGLTLVTYILKYRWEGDEIWQTMNFKESIYCVDNLRTCMATLTGLAHPYGFYYVKVQTVNKNKNKNKSGFSTEAHGRTTETVPVDVPGNFICKPEVIGDNKRNIHLSWELLPNKFKRNGEIRDQIISVRQLLHTKESVDKWVVGPNETSYTLKGMQLKERYQISIRARNSNGISRNSSFCEILIAPAGLSSFWVTIIVISVIGLILVVLWKMHNCYRKMMRKFPDFHLPPQLGNNNLYHSAHRTITREVEVFNDLSPCKDLFVDLTAEKHPLDSPGVTCSEAFTDAFDISNKHRGMVAGFQLPDQDVPYQRNRHWSSDTCSGSSLPSPISVGSGGSYFVLRESDHVSYSHVTQDGLSPMKKNDVEGQKFRGEGSTADGFLTRDLDLEDDIEGVVSISGINPDDGGFKVDSSQRVLYTRKHVSPGPSDQAQAYQPRLQNASPKSHVKSRDAAFIFGLDQVTEEQEVDSISVSNHANIEGFEGEIGNDDDSGKDSMNGIERFILSSETSLESEFHTLPELDGCQIPNGTREVVFASEVACSGHETQDARASTNISKHEGVTPGEDSVNMESSDHPNSVDDVEEYGDVSWDMQGEILDKYDTTLNYIAVVADDNSSDEEDGHKTEMATTWTLSGTDPSPCHSFSSPGRSDGTYIDEVQLASISPVASPTRMGLN